MLKSLTMTTDLRGQCLVTAHSLSVGWSVVCAGVMALTPCLPSLRHRQYVGSFPVDDLDTQEGVYLVQQQLWALQVRSLGAKPRAVHYEYQSWMEP